MRPIERGDVPLDANEQPKEFSAYKYARQDLIDRMGEYCSYCEMRLNASLAVEHVKPKVNHPDLRLQWSNFLLACGNCNSIKGSTDIELDDFYWPDRDNTFLAIEYQEGGRVRANPNLTPGQMKKAEKTIKLTGLDRVPGNDSAASDRRWINRREAWDIAVDSLKDLKKDDSKSMRRQIVRTAKAGYWSVWMTVFRTDADMRRRFIEEFRGTSKECFDGDCNEVHRPDGAI